LTFVSLAGSKLRHSASKAYVYADSYFLFSQKYGILFQLFSKFKVLLISMNVLAILNRISHMPVTDTFWNI